MTRPVDWTGGAAAFSQCKVVVYDFGVKRGFLRRLAQVGCSVRVVPSGYPADKTLGENPVAVIFSPGVGVTDIRLEPMPAATHLLGLVPLALGWGAGGEAQAPMARAVVGGLFTSTLITLLVIPVIYSLMETKRELSGSTSKRLQPVDAEPAD